MAGPAPTTLREKRDRSAGRVHSSGWLAGLRRRRDADRRTTLGTPLFGRPKIVITFDTLPQPTVTEFGGDLRFHPPSDSTVKGELQNPAGNLHEDHERICDRVEVSHRGPNDEEHNDQNV